MSKSDTEPEMNECAGCGDSFETEFMFIDRKGDAICEICVSNGGWIWCEECGYYVEEYEFGGCDNKDVPICEECGGCSDCEQCGHCSDSEK